MHGRWGFLRGNFGHNINARANGKPLSLQESACPVCGLRSLAARMVARGSAGAQLSYWRKQLENLPVLNLPTDHAQAGEAEFSRGKATDIVAAVSNRGSQ